MIVDNGECIRYNKNIQNKNDLILFFVYSDAVSTTFKTVK